MEKQQKKGQMIDIKDAMKGLSTENKKFVSISNTETGVYCGRIGWENKEKTGEQYLWLFWCPEKEPLEVIISEIESLLAKSQLGGTLAIDLGDLDHIPMSVEILTLSDEGGTIHRPFILSDRSNECVAIFVGQSGRLKESDMYGIITIILGGIIQPAIPREELGKYPCLKDAYERMKEVGAFLGPKV